MASIGEVREGLNQVAQGLDETADSGHLHNAIETHQSATEQLEAIRETGLTLRQQIGNLAITLHRSGVSQVAAADELKEREEQILGLLQGSENEPLQGAAATMGLLAANLEVTAATGLRTYNEEGVQIQAALDQVGIWLGTILLKVREDAESLEKTRGAVKGTATTVRDEAAKM